MKRYRPFIEFRRREMGPGEARFFPYLGVNPYQRNRISITLPELPDQTIRCWHELLRETLVAFENHYQPELARAYGWASADAEDEYEEEEENEEASQWGDEDL